MAVTGPKQSALVRPTTPPTLGGTVLIGFADALAAPEVAWSLLDAGAHVVAFARRGRRSALRRSRHVSVIDITAPERDCRAALDDLARATARCAPSAVMPLDDAALWLCDAAARAGLGAPVAGPTGATAQLALDKGRQIAAATDAGFSVPLTQMITSRGQLDGVSEFPFVLKPVAAAHEHDGRLRRGSAAVCADVHERERAAREWSGERMLAQPLIHGTGEGLFGLAGPEGIWALSAHRRVRMANPQGSGSSACMSVAVDPELATCAERMLVAAGWRGMFMLEFLRDRNGTPWFMELNGRPWGSMALARALGLEYPAWAMRQLEDPCFRPDCEIREGQLCRHLGRELVHLAMVMRGPRSAALSQWPSRRATVSDVLRVHRGERWYNWRRGELALFVDDTVSTLLAHLGRR